MPIFEYECKKCKKNFELLLRSPKEEPECPHCSSKQLTKLVSSFAASDGSSKDCPSGGPCTNDSGPSHHCCGGSCGCGH